MELQWKGKGGCVLQAIKAIIFKYLCYCYIQEQQKEKEEAEVSELKRKFVDSSYLGSIKQSFRAPGRPLHVITHPNCPRQL